MDFSSGSLLSTYYRIEEPIGQGGMATVYRARHTVLDSLHAIKVLQPHLAADRELRMRFLQEGRIQAGVRHPHILPVTDLINEPGCAGLVMRWLDGSDLRSRLEAGAVSLEESLLWTLQTLSALAHVHDKGIIHRDLKPENLFLEQLREGVHLQVMDFGIAKVIDKQHTQTGTALGSLCYMSPEQVEDPRSVDHRSDLFAVGAILYELVSGVVAFDGETDFEVMTRITKGHYPPLAAALADTPVLCTIIARALAVERAARFQSADDFAHALRAIQRTELRSDRLVRLKERAARLGLESESWWVPRDLTDGWLDSAAKTLDEQALRRQASVEAQLAAAQSQIERLTLAQAQLSTQQQEVERARLQLADLRGKLTDKTRAFDDMAEARRMTMLELDAYEERLLHTLSSERRLKQLIAILLGLVVLGLLLSQAIG